LSEVILKYTIIMSHNKSCRDGVWFWARSRSPTY